MVSFWHIIESHEFTIMQKQTYFAAILLCCLLTLNFSFVDHTEAYINGYSNVAIREMNRVGIPASITLAQGIQESSWGGGTLAREANNHFGIKCKVDWTGKTYYIEDDDYDQNGNLTKSCFRAYESIDDSYIDHSDFLMNNPRYARLFEIPITDYKAWAHGLKECGYATDPEYAIKLIRNIEKYQLFQYDVPTQTVEEEIIAATPPPAFEVPLEAPSSPSIAGTGTYEYEVGAEEEVKPINEYEVEIQEDDIEVPAAFVLPDNYSRKINTPNYSMPFDRPIVAEQPIIQNEVTTTTQVIKEEAVPSYPSSAEIIQEELPADIPTETTIISSSTSATFEAPSYHLEETTNSFIRQTVAPNVPDLPEKVISSTLSRDGKMQQLTRRLKSVSTIRR